MLWHDQPPITYDSSLSPYELLFRFEALVSEFRRVSAPVSRLSLRDNQYEILEYRRRLTAIRRQFYDDPRLDNELLNNADDRVTNALRHRGLL